MVSDGTHTSAADTTTVRVRESLNPSTAPCAALTGVAGVNTGLISITGRTDSSFTFSPVSGGANDLYVCRPDGASEKLADDVNTNHEETVSGLTSGTRYWAAVIWWDGTLMQNFWSGWQAVDTTGGTSIVAARFTSSPASGDTYRNGETIEAQVTWSKAVTVTLDDGGSNEDVSLRLDLGEDDDDLTNSQRKMAYVSGSATATLTFR